MTPQQINETANQKTQAICAAILSFLEKGKQRRKGAINLLAISKRSGIHNVGSVLRRKTISLAIVLRLLQTIEILCAESGADFEPLRYKIKDAL